MKKKLLARILCAVIAATMILTLAVPALAYGAQNIIDAAFVLEPGTDVSESYKAFRLPEKQTITIELDFIDLGSKPGKISFGIVNAEDIGNSIYYEENLTSDKSINKKLSLNAGVYIAATKLSDWMILYDSDGNPMPSDEFVEVRLTIKGKGEIVDLNDLIYGGGNCEYGTGDDSGEYIDYSELDIPEVVEIKSGEVYVAYHDTQYNKRKYKVKVSKPGYITFTIDVDGLNYAASRFALLDKNEKEISSLEYVEMKNGKIQHTYAVGKGTYYVLVQNTLGVQAVKYKFTAVTDKGGSSKSKATTIKLGDKVKGLALVSDKTSKVDWYKFTLNSKKAVTVTVNYKVAGSLKVQIVDSKGNELIGGYRTAYAGDGTLKMLTNAGKLSKGTYYIKVYKGDAESSAYYDIKVK